MRRQLANKVVYNTEIHLLINYYVVEHKERQAEIDEALKLNLQNNQINRIHIIVEKESIIPNWIKKEKVQIVIMNNRMTYNQFFSYSKQNIENKSICIISNADISFDDSIKNVKDYVNKNVCLALTRHNKIDGKLRLFNRRDSQDAWVYINPLRELEDNTNFILGTPGCDNRIAFILKKKYKLKNPARKIILTHHHESGFRTYKRSEKIVGNISLVDIE